MSSLTQPVPCPLCGATYGHHLDCPISSHTSNPNILPLEAGCDTTRKSEPLYERINQVIEEPFFADMTMVEVLGTLHLVMETQTARMGVPQE